MARYEKLDELLKSLDGVLRKEVNRLDVTGFDELNAITTKRLTKDMTDRLTKENRKAYKEMAKEATHEVALELDELNVLTPKTIYPTNEYIDGLLGEYNPITDYLYYPEVERKRSRLYEAIMVALLMNNRTKYHDALRKFASLWHTQTTEYGITVIDKTRTKTMTINGIKKVRWVAEKDEKTCEVCKKRDGKVYEVGKIPPKPHYNCRCWVVPIIEKNS